MAVIFAPAAVQDIEEIGDYIQLKIQLPLDAS
jgi:hypothetical protein